MHPYPERVEALRVYLIADHQYSTRRMSANGTQKICAERSQTPLFSRVNGLPHRPSSSERQYPRISYRRFPLTGLRYHSAYTASRSTRAITFR